MPDRWAAMTSNDMIESERLDLGEGREDTVIRQENVGPAASSGAASTRTGTHRRSTQRHMDDARDDPSGNPTTAPAGPDAQSQDVAAEIGERPPFASTAPEPVDPDAPANGAVDPVRENPPEPNEPA